LDLAELVKNICSEGDDDLISWLRSALLTASFTKASKSRLTLSLYSRGG